MGAAHVLARVAGCHVLVHRLLRRRRPVPPSAFHAVLVWRSDGDSVARNLLFEGRAAQVAMGRCQEMTYRGGAVSMR